MEMQWGSVDWPLAMTVNSASLFASNISCVRDITPWWTKIIFHTTQFSTLEIPIALAVITDYSFVYCLACFQGSVVLWNDCSVCKWPAFQLYTHWNDLHSNTIFFKFPTFIDNSTADARTSEVGAIIFWNVSENNKCFRPSVWWFSPS